jgi:hypothetical protein
MKGEGSLKMLPTGLPQSGRAGDGAGPNCLIVGQDASGRWIVRDGAGLKAGIFGSFGAALQFAKEEARDSNGTIIVSPQQLELGVEL